MSALVGSETLALRLMGRQTVPYWDGEADLRRRGARIDFEILVVMIEDGGWALTGDLVGRLGYRQQAIVGRLRALVRAGTIEQAGPEAREEMLAVRWALERPGSGWQLTEQATRRIATR